MNSILDKDSQIELLKNEVKELKELNNKLQERLSKYTNPKRVKDWQDQNKDSIKEYQKEYQKKYYQNKKNQY